MDRFRFGVSSKKELASRPSAWLLSCLSGLLKQKVRTTSGGMLTHEGPHKSSDIRPPFHILSSISRSSCVPTCHSQGTRFGRLQNYAFPLATTAPPQSRIY